MSVYSQISFKLFGKFSDDLIIFFPNLNEDLRRAGLRTSNKEYISSCVTSSILFLAIELPLLAFIFGFLFATTLTSLITAISASLALTLFIFYLFTQYPKIVVSDRAKKIDSYLPFGSLYLSTIASAKLPLDKIFKFFGKYSSYKEFTEQIEKINNDIDVFGLDAHTALERAIERSPSKKMKEMLWGILSTSMSGGDIGIYLREKSKSQMNDYRLAIYQFSKKLTLFAEIYLTAIILGSIFFLILTSLFSGITGAGSNIILLQSFLIFIFLPLVSLAFILFIKMTAPPGE